MHHKAVRAAEKDISRREGGEGRSQQAGADLPSGSQQVLMCGGEGACQRNGREARQLEWSEGGRNCVRELKGGGKRERSAVWGQEGLALRHCKDAGLHVKELGAP